MNMYDRITDNLKQQGKTRKDLSQAINVSYNTLTSQFQRNSKNIKLDTISLIASYLGVSVDYLITGNSNNIYANETNDFNYNDLDRELSIVIKSLSFKNKTILLAKAYELDDNK